MRRRNSAPAYKITGPRTAVRTKRRPPGAGAIILLTLAALLIVGAGGAGFWLWRTVAEGTAPLASPNDSMQTTDADGFPEVDWNYWLDKNSAVVGWITIPDTDVDFPIVQAPTNQPDFFLRHGINGRYSLVGTPYLDAGCASSGLLDSRNAVVFGHNLTDMPGGHGMFSTLARYSDQAFAKEHNVILVQTPSQKQMYEVIATEVTSGSATTKRTEFSSDEDFQRWLAERITQSKMVLPSANNAAPQRILSLVTCSYNYVDYTQNERTIVYAKPI